MIIVLVTKVEKRKLPEWPSRDEWVNTVSFMHMSIFSSDSKERYRRRHITVWQDIENLEKLNTYLRISKKLFESETPACKQLSLQ